MNNKLVLKIRLPDNTQLFVLNENQYPNNREYTVVSFSHIDNNGFQWFETTKDKIYLQRDRYEVIKSFDNFIISNTYIDTGENRLKNIEDSLEDILEILRK